jgi:hypothetical protein
MVHKKYHKLQCKCPEGERLVKEYEEAKVIFDDLKDCFAKIKLQQSFTFISLLDFCNKLMCLSLDFEEEELQFR